MKVIDINPGFIADNILQSLYNCDQKALLKLAEKDLLRTNNAFPRLTNQSIRCIGLEAYAKVAGVPLSYFFFRSLTPPVPRYTPYDNFVVAQLNNMTASQLSSLRASLDLFFPNPLFYLAETDYRERAISVMEHLLPYPISNIAPESEPYKGLAREDVQQLLDNFKIKRRAGYKIDTIVDISTFLGVNLHWMLNFKKYTLFCKTIQAEQIFSYYTLLQKGQQQQFLHVLWQCINVDYVHEYLGMRGSRNE